MDMKPIHYDGSGHGSTNHTPVKKEAFTITDEMRKSISGNPYVMK